MFVLRTDTGTFAEKAMAFQVILILGNRQIRPVPLVQGLPMQKCIGRSNKEGATV